MALNSMGMGFMFTATDLASGVMERVKGNLNSLAEASGRTVEGLDTRMKKFGTGLTAMAIGFGAVRAGFAMATAAGEFEGALVRVGNIANASAEEFDLLEAAAIRAGVATQFSPTEAVLGLKSLTQAGYNVKESIDLLNPVLLLAASSMGQMGPEEAAGLAAQAMKAFGIEADLAGIAVDQMNKAANVFAMDITDLPLGLGAASRGAQAINQSMTETLVTFGMIKDVIPGTERAATATAVSMERLADPKIQQALKKIGVSAVDATTGGFRPFLDVIGDLKPELDKMSESQRAAFLQTTFGQEALAGMNAILSRMESGVKTASGELLKGSDVLQYFRDQVIDSSGAAEKASQAYLKTYDGQKKLISGSLQTLMITMGKPFKEVLQPVLELVLAGINGFLGVMRKMPAPVLNAVVAGTLLSFALIGVLGGILMVQAIFPLLITGLGLVKLALFGMAAAAWAAIAPLLPFIAAAAVVGGMIYAVKNNLFGLGDAWDYWVGVFRSDEMQSVGKWLLLILGPIAGGYGVTVGLAKIVPMLTQGVFGLSGAFRALGIAMFANPIGLIVAGLAAIVLGILAVKNNWFGLGDAWHAGAMIIGEFFENFDKTWAEIQTNFRVGIDVIVEAIARMLGWFDKVADKVGGIWDLVSGVFGGTPGAVGAPLPAAMQPGPPAAVPTAPRTGAPMASFAEAARSSPSPSRATMPALAAAGDVSSEEPMSSEPETSSSIDYEKLAAAMAKRPMMTVVEIDGERIATATSNAQRDRMARSGIPVSSE